MTEFLHVPGGRIAYDVTGSGPLVVLLHGIGVRRQDYRFLAPVLAQAGHRAASANLRGHASTNAVRGLPAVSALVLIGCRDGCLRRRSSRTGSEQAIPGSGANQAAAAWSAAASGILRLV
jgi:pimeloyl-ACP methyl ester carboxylesterase